MLREKHSKTNPLAPTHELYPIGTVSEMTGIKTITLRAWERRYGLITPSRSENGRRLYSTQDVQKIKDVTQLLEEGISISRAATIVKNKKIVTTEKTSTGDIWQEYLHNILQSIREFDEYSLDQAYNEITSLYPVDLVTQKLILPLLDELGYQWETRDGSVAEEHFFSVYLRNKLGARFHHQNRVNFGEPIVIAGLPGDNHEFGLLLFALTLISHGNRVLILGGNLPVSELSHTLNIVNASVVVLTGSHDLNIKRIISQLKQLKTKHQLPIFIGGKVASRYSDEFGENGFYPLGTNLRTAINHIETYISTNSHKGHTS